MQMMGILDDFIKLIMAATPPLSPELIPSTSSIIRTDFVKTLLVVRLKEPDYIVFTPLRLRTSLALNSVMAKLYYIASKRAVVVLPIPGSPLMSAALELIDPAAFHPLISFTSLLFPLI